MRTVKRTRGVGRALLLVAVAFLVLSASDENRCPSLAQTGPKPVAGEPAHEPTYVYISMGEHRHAEQKTGEIMLWVGQVTPLYVWPLIPPGADEGEFTFVFDEKTHRVWRSPDQQGAVRSGETFSIRGTVLYVEVYALGTGTTLTVSFETKASSGAGF